MINKLIGGKVSSSTAVAPVLGIEKRHARWNDLMAKTRPALAVRPVKQKVHEKVLSQIFINMHCCRDRLHVVFRARLGISIIEYVVFLDM